MTASSFADVLPPIDGRPPIGTEAWWFSVARRDLQGARRAFESAEQIKRCGGYGWRKRRASWFAGALEWLSMAIDARNHGRELRAKRLVVGLAKADELAKRISRPGVTMSRTDAFRAAIAAGFDVLADESPKKPATRKR